MDIKLSQLYKEFNYGSQIRPILSGISTSFERGTAYAITGRSGCGKSTLLHIIAGFESPSRGSVAFTMKECTIGFMFQAPYLLAELSVLENCIMPGLLKGFSWHSAQQKAVALLKRLELIEKQHELPATLSGGQQQRVAFARALLTDPAFIIADEPTSNLDPETAQIIITILKEQQLDHNVGLIICSHDQLVAQHMNIKMQLTNGLLYQQE